MMEQDARIQAGGWYPAPISLHENGRLEYCKLAMVATIDGVNFPRDSILFVDPQGKVVKAE